LRTTATPGADPTVGTPIPLQNRGSFISGGGTGATATPRLSGGAQVVTPIPKKAGESLPPLTPPTATRLPPAFQITGALKERKVIYQETPIYPPSLRARGVESSVKLKFNVSAEGNVKEVTVLLSSGYRDMDMAAVSALRKWSFAPLDRYEDQEGIILMTFSLR
jgi:TonB family protein